MQERKVSIGGTDYPMHEPVLRAGDAEPRSSRKAPIRCPKPSSTASCSSSRSITPATRRKSRSCGRARRTCSRRSARCCTATTSCSLQHIVRRVPVADHVFALRQAHHAHDPAGHAGGGRLRQQVADLGRRPACQHEPDPGRQGARGPARATSTSRPTTWPRSPRRSCGIASSRTSPPRAKASRVDDVIQRLLRAVPKNQAA